VVGSVEEELDAVMRFIKNHYITQSDTSMRLQSTTTKEMSPRSHPAPHRLRRSRSHIPPNDLSSDAVMVYSDLNDRSVRIKTVLEATPNATIKDLSDVITDVSSKTIQRELNSLIEKGEVIRQGERRWSTYNVRK
jgi:predicted HTH transcriptional regulator